VFPCGMRKPATSMASPGVLAPGYPGSRQHYRCIGEMLAPTIDVTPESAREFEDDPYGR
jgi:hypothetical protein